MTEEFEIKGGADEFEAAIIAVVLDRVAADERAARRPPPEPGLPAWVRALDPEPPDLVIDFPTP